jgi:antitoxin YefM
MTIQVSEDIVPAAVFKRQQSAILRRLRDSRRPVIITQHGQAAAVVLSPREYDRLTGELELREALARAEQADAEGRVVSHAEALDRFKAVLERRGRA